MQKTRLVCLLLFLILTACTKTAVPSPTPILTPTHTAIVTQPATAVPPTTRPPTPTVDTGLATTPPPTLDAATFTWPPPHAPYEQLSRAPVTADEQLTTQLLAGSYPPERDDLALFAAYKGVTPTEDNPPLADVLSVGLRQTITVNNIDSNTNTSPEFVLKHISEHAYFWFDTTPGLFEPTAAELAAMGAGFDEIYERSHLYFGPEASPGIDGDPRIHIVNASPLNLCDIGPDELDFCYLAGYFSSGDLLPQSVDPASNAREMFVMNGRAFGRPGYLDTLAHEFRHMIEENYDINDWDWAVEGSAMLAEELLGYPGDGVARANVFLENPDQQLNRWTDGNTIPYYGQGYLLNRYILNRLGPDLYREFAAHPEPAFTALDDLAQTYNLDFGSGLMLWLDWLVALAIHNHPQAPDSYTLNDGVDTAVSHPLANTETTVHQFAADYYQIPAGQKTTVTFTGSNHVPLMPQLPTSGTHMWLANRANYSAASLTRAFDLTGVTEATLAYDIYHDIETGYDFAYVTLSVDGGQTWQSLAGRHMQGTAFEDDPSDSAFTARFYTGQSLEWLREEVDLTPFAGQEIVLRFEYVTDPILTFDGLALDNISIPEIGFFDDAETDGGWQANGFVRATGYVPQPWHLILITFNQDGPMVTQITLAPDNTAVVPVPDSSEDAILIVAAAAPMTLQPAVYQVSIAR